MYLPTLSSTMLVHPLEWCVEGLFLIDPWPLGLHYYVFLK